MPDRRNAHMLDSVRADSKVIPLSFALEVEKDRENIEQATKEAQRALANIGRQCEVARRINDLIMWVRGKVVDVHQIKLAPYIGIPTRKLGMWPIYEVLLVTGDTEYPGLLEMRFLSEQASGAVGAVATIECPLCHKTIEIPAYDTVTRTEALKRHLETECISKSNLGGASMGISPHCQLILKQPMTRELAYDFRGIRGRVMCHAWETMQEKRVPFRDAIREAWGKVKEEAAAVGAYV